MTKLYYQAPTDEQFLEVQDASITIWKERYPESISAAEKVSHIAKMENVSDNFMYIVAMFDWINQRLLARKLSPETRKAIKDRLISGGAYPEEVMFWE